LVAVVAKTAIRVQVAIIYFHAFVGKLQVPEWVDGTVLWYWLNDPTFGPAHWLRPLVINFAATSVGIVLMTWGTLMLEGSLAIAMFLPQRIQRRLLIAGIAFHSGIALLMGLVSFGLAMISALILYLRPWEEPFAMPFESLAGIAARVQGRLALSPVGSARTVGTESVPTRDV
jgi:antimicrobial peptide system SdpB family protein